VTRFWWHTNGHLWLWFHYIDSREIES